jgi:hypothetical protein
LIHSIIRHNKIKPLVQRFTDLGFISQIEIIKITGLNRKNLRKLRDSGTITNYKVIEKTQYLYKLEDFNAFMAR